MAPIPSKIHLSLRAPLKTALASWAPSINIIIIIIIISKFILHITILAVRNQDMTIIKKFVIDMTTGFKPIGESC